jgi:hypothetical protein
VTHAALESPGFLSNALMHKRLGVDGCGQRTRAHTHSRTRAQQQGGALGVRREKVEARPADPDPRTAAGALLRPGMIPATWTRIPEPANGSAVRVFPFNPGTDLSYMRLQSHHDQTGEHTVQKHVDQLRMIERRQIEYVPNPPIRPAPPDRPSPLFQREGVRNERIDRRERSKTSLKPSGSNSLQSVRPNRPKRKRNDWTLPTWHAESASGGGR